MKNWSQKQPNLFKKCVYNLAGLDTTREQKDAASLNRVYYLHK